MRNSYNTVTQDEPVLNLAALNVLAGDDQKFVPQMLVRFVDQMGDSIPALYRYYKRQDYSKMTSLAKQLKTDTAALGMHDLQPVLVAIEKFDTNKNSTLDLENRIRQVQRTLTCGVEEARKLV